ncbi:MAG: 3',5'-cyclic-nucleotide phosphodiesterase [Burkholderiaceae bacterium]|jgi:ribonuclease BN (tRNA processing enzyme)|nr:3',5'-cyclic-nucleotide phosphodiesterase [Burkholderiaceae bacterium]
MKVRVLGCAANIAQGCKTTSFLVDHDVLIDAGTGVGDLTREEMLRIDDVFITHAHMDHIACLPLMVGAVVTARAGRPLRIHALPQTLQALHAHIFNGIIWPDFSRLPSPGAPAITLHPIGIGEPVLTRSHTVEPLPAHHGVPACGFAVRASAPDAPWWVFSGDTEHCPAFWQRINAMNVGALAIETTFPNRERALAQLTRHYCSETLATGLNQIAPGRHYPIHITHAKPSESKTILREIAQLAPSTTHPIHMLRAGQVFEW